MTFDTSTTLVEHAGLARLRDFIHEMPSVLVAFSGGVDSTFLLCIAHEILGARVAAATAVSPTYPAHQLSQATALAEQMGVRHLILQSDQMAHNRFTKNDRDRCYHCKDELYDKLSRLATREGYRVVIDGTNTDDLSDVRPGVKAARDWNVRSPLAEAGLTKTEIRALSRLYRLPTWDQPASPCLSSRFPFGTTITPERLRQVEAAETWLHTHQFRDVRVRYHGELARIEIALNEWERFIREPGLQARLVDHLRGLGFRYVTLDLQGYRQGEFNAS